MGRPHTSGSWQKPRPVCHLRLETLQAYFGVGFRLQVLVSLTRFIYAEASSGALNCDAVLQREFRGYAGVTGCANCGVGAVVMSETALAAAIESPTVGFADNPGAGVSKQAPEFVGTQG